MDLTRGNLWQTFNLGVGWVGKIGTVPIDISKGYEVSRQIEHTRNEAATMKKILATVLTCALLTSLFTMPALAAQDEFTMYPDVAGVLQQYNGTAEHLVVPDGVRIIMRNAFGGTTYRTKSIVLPDSVTLIEDEAFMQSGVETLHLGAGVASIGDDAFRQTDHLKTITVSPNNPVFYSTGNALYNKTTKALVWSSFLQDLPTAQLMNGLKRIEDNGFMKMFGSKFTYAQLWDVLEVPATLEYLGQTLTVRPKEGQAVYYLPEHLQYAGGYPSFENLGNPNCQLYIPADFLYMDSSPYGWGGYQVAAENPAYKAVDGVLFSKDGTVLIRYPETSSRTSYTIPAGVKKIEEYAFANAGNLTQVIFPDGVEAICRNAFEGVPLSNLILPEGLEYIGVSAFYAPKDKGLQDTRLTLPQSMKTLVGPIFGWTEQSNVQEIVALNPNMYLTGESGALNSSYYFKKGESDTITVHGASGGLLEEKVVNKGIAFVSTGICEAQESESPDSTYHSYNIAFGGRTPYAIVPRGTDAKASLSSDGVLTIPEGTISVDELTLEGIDVEKVRSIALPGSLKRIDAAAFSQCQKLTGTLTIPANVQEVGASAFRRGSLKTIRILNPELEVPANLFSDLHDDPENFFTTYIPADILVEGYSDSSAQAYAKGWGLRFQSIGALPTPAANIPSGWAQAEIEAARNAGLVPPLTDNPRYQADITREQFAELALQMVTVACGEGPDVSQALSFTDCDNPSVLAASAAGIVSGVTAGVFQPKGVANREQIATMVVRAIGYIEGKTESKLVPKPAAIEQFSDKEQVSPWAVEGVGALVANGIMSGTSATTLSPKNACSVEQSILLLYRVYQQYQVVNPGPT